MSVFYVDSSAWGKLLVDEDESAEFENFVDEALGRGDALVSSELLTAELYRLAARIGAPATSVTTLLSILHLSLPTQAVFRSAGLLDGNVRSLDALHVAAALDLDADGFISYDRRQVEAAEAAGLLTSSPR
ncbi:MAG: type II toxin-antitoxin system VapC family toxin [Actinomycetales bacterium]|nr:type II toxin-antitoxin system VapC family toxin [Actinomycetales bacterium]